MKAASLLIVLSLAAVAVAGPAFNKDNQIYSQQQQQQQDSAKGPAIDALKQWCFSSQMSQQELTGSFKKLVAIVKSQPADQATEAAVMNERICQGAIVQKSQQTGEAVAQTGADAQAHELIKDVYMDALISCKSRTCQQQLLKIINSHKLDNVRAAYYMTSIAVTEKDSLTDAEEIKQLADSFAENKQQQQQQSESIERQQLFAVTSLIGKWCQQKPTQWTAIKPTIEKVAKTIEQRYIKSVSEQEMQQYKQQQQQQQQPSEQIAKKIAKRNAALRALANIPGYVLKQTSIDDTCAEIAQNNQEASTARQSAIECLAQNDKQTQLLKQITFDQQEPIEVRVAAYRTLMTTVYADDKKDEQQKQQQASEIVDQVVKHCERQQQQDDQFVMYAISHLDNVRTSQQPEQQAIKECIAKNKQHNMQIQVLAKKLKEKLADVRSSSRNYKLEQEFNQLESGLVLDGDIVYESKQKQQQQDILPKMVRVNISTPVMGETVNVVELTVRQSGMDAEVLGALKLVQGAKINGASAMSKVVDSFKTSMNKQQQQQKQQQDNQDQDDQDQDNQDQDQDNQDTDSYGQNKNNRNKYNNNNNNNNNNKQQQQQPELDLTVKIDGRTVMYLCADDFKYSTSNTNNQQHQRNTRSIQSSASIVDDIIEYLKREPVAFNRGFNFNFNERIAKVLDVEANMIAGLRFESRAQGNSAQDYEIVAKIEPRMSLETIVGPAGAKKMLQRVSTKTALAMRLRYKKNELVDVELDLPMNTMDVFTVESQLVEQSRSQKDSYNYLPESIYGQEDIYNSNSNTNSYFDDSDDNNDNQTEQKQMFRRGNKLAKRSIFESAAEKLGYGKQQSAVAKLFNSKTISNTLETPEQFARATGLRAKLRYVVSPKDMAVLCTAQIEKTDSQMRGYRVQAQKLTQGGSQKQYLVTVSTPGSRQDRTTQIRVASQNTAQRTYIKTEVQTPQTAFATTTELVHDGRQYSCKSEIVTKQQGRQAQRHSFEAGVQSTSNGRLGSGNTVSFKPYVSIESPKLQRPIQVQGAVSYQQSPKSVISYELKSGANAGQQQQQYIQGKFIVEQRDGASRKSRSSSMYSRRSMQSPIELLLQNDITLSHELIAKVEEHALKMHQMIDWDSDKLAIKADCANQYKNMRTGDEQQLTGAFKFADEEQYVRVERKSPNKPQKDFRAQLVSQLKSATEHQLQAEYRYQNSRRQQQLAAYKHKVELQKVGQNKYEASAQFELVDTERQINEKASGRARVGTDRKMKTCQVELNAGNQKSAKLNVEFESLEKHHIQVSVQTERFSHKQEVRNTERQLSMQSRTDKNGQLVAKCVVEAQKQPGAQEAQIVVEVPSKRVHVAADLKLSPGRVSSIAVQTPQFASKSEFSFDAAMRQYRKQQWSMFDGLKQNMRFKTNLKDLMHRESYWLDSALNFGDNQKPSYIRADSPVYRTDVEFEPREWTTKFGAFARQKRSTNSYDQIYSTRDSLISALALEAGKLTAGSGALGQNKLWMLRSVLSSPSTMDSLKQKARRALFEYADREQSHKHSCQYQPDTQRFQFDLEHSPATGNSGFESRRMTGDLDTSFERPSRMSLKSDSMDFDLDTKPFDGEEAYAKISALARERRSTDGNKKAAFKKHESEWRYKREHGHKAWMKHEDSQGKRHELTMETDESPKKHTKLAYESDKHGKGAYEHQWRKHVQKRAHDQEDVYANSMTMRHESPSGQWAHEQSLNWQEPIRMSQQQQQQKSSIRDMFENVNGRYQAQLRMPRSTGYYSQKQQQQQQQDKYEVDFDYQPQLNSARLNMRMPQDLAHETSFELKPASNYFKAASKLMNSRTQEPIYSIYAATKQQMPSNLATADQEPSFVDYEHQMLERQVRNSPLASVFKQPIKFDYTDKFGRVASIDYDQSPNMAANQQQQQLFAGLRQKRAAFYYKDEPSQFEHSSSVDFYPETLFGGIQSSRYNKYNNNNNNNNKRMMSFGGRTEGMTLKAETKYGPVVMRADSNGQTDSVELQSPICNAKLEQTRVGDKTLYRVYADNKSQQVDMSKLIRNVAGLRDSKTAKQIARQFDSCRFEHETELLVSIVNSIAKIKSQTKVDGRQELNIEGELNKQQNKAYMKVNGERVEGQAVVDLSRKSAELVLSADDKRTMQHVTRVERTSNKYYTIESMTSYKSKPVFKMTGKLSAAIVDEPSHLFERKSNKQQQYQQDGHISTFEAMIYEPTEYHVVGEYDCEEKQAHIVFKNLDENKTQETRVKFDDNTDSFIVDARLSGPHGQVYSSKGKLSLAGLKDAENCTQYQSAYACQSEVVYSDNQSNNYGAKLVPGEYVAVMTPNGKQTFNWSKY